jgi:hypothetical protein
MLGKARGAVLDRSAGAPGLERTSRRSVSSEQRTLNLLTPFLRLVFRAYCAA